MRTRKLRENLWPCGVLAALLMAAAAGQAQSNAPGLGRMPSPASAPQVGPPRDAAASQSDYSDDNVTEAQIRLRLVYQAQQKQMVKDTYKLVDLSRKLNAEVASQNGAPLTRAERHELAQIEKLARSVRMKMTAPIPDTLFQVGNYTSMTFR